MYQITIGIAILAVIITAIISYNLGLKHGADSKVCVESDCSFECSPSGCRLVNKKADGVKLFSDKDDCDSKCSKNK